MPMTSNFLGIRLPFALSVGSWVIARCPLSGASARAIHRRRWRRARDEPLAALCANPLVGARLSARS